MLVAKRDPFHPGADDVSLTRSAGAPRLARVYSLLQICGTLLAVPVGLASAYSVYRTNFSVETTCQNLRVNIVAMLDKGVDATARHMLVRRDVEAFERSCGEVDPDATAAFKTLLAVDKQSPPAVVPVASPAAATVMPKAETAQKAEAKPETVIRKIETRPTVAAKQPSAPVAEAKPIQRDAAISDAAWLGAVRQALTKKGRDPAVASVAAPVAIAPPAAVAAQPVAPASLEKRPLGELRTTIPARAPAAAPEPLAPPVSLAPPAQAPAPALPVPVANAPVQQADDDHPVPPGMIPDAVPENVEKPESRSKLGALIAKIPFVGSVLDR